MSDKILQTRIKQKIDTKANWDKAVNFVPLKGEIIVYSDLNKIKVGDGAKKVSELPFLADSDTHQSIKALNTNNTSAQTVSSSEAIAGSGTINLHKVAKTGSYNDLNDKPDSVTSVATADGITGGPITASGTIKANLKSYTKNTAEIGGRLYGVELDKNGKLAVNVPWTDTNTDTHNSHAIISGTKSDGSTQIKGSASSGDITLGDSGVTAGAYGDTAAQTPGYNATFKVPSISVNAKGIVTAIGEHTVRIPASDNTDTKNTAVQRMTLVRYI